MPADIFFESDDSEFSETDWSVHGRKGRASTRRRSVSRPRRTEVRETLTVPMQSTRVTRSSSTGGRRHRDRSAVPAVMIVNEQAQRTDNSNSNKPRRVQQKVVDHDFDEEVVTSRRRAVTGVSREPSPFIHERDTELALNQKLLEKSDLRQDLEIWKQQQEIERLERELEKHRERAEPRDPRESRLLREEEEWYEDEISDRLRRLERFERKNRAEEERRNLEKDWRLKRLEESEREAADRTRAEEERRKLEKDWRLKRLEESEREAAERKAWRLKQLEEHEKEAAEREELKQKIREEKGRGKEKKEQAMKAAAIEEWKLEQERIKQRQKEEAIKKDKEFRERLRLEFGYTEEEIEQILNKKKKAEKEKEKKEKKEEIIEEKTTWIKVHRKHLLPETLLAYNLPWDWDERDSNYIIIKRWVTEDFQEELFAHTRRIREGKLVAQTSSSTTELKINDRNKDKMYLVRKKSPSRRLRIFA
ncbi:myosin heavy chain, clone [Penicillium brasilianum]|uniref:Myosin heavy chain, clone n=1 Tax=Penicillium brasilianum TaxID=104259 RepID=A0A1S9RBF5_PENBI|nr:myosin heavy chain, clone [Penicillium brasilianum]